MSWQRSFQLFARHLALSDHGTVQRQTKASGKHDAESQAASQGKSAAAQARAIGNCRRRPSAIKNFWFSRSINCGNFCWVHPPCKINLSQHLREVSSRSLKITQYAIESEQADALQTALDFYNTSSDAWEHHERRIWFYNKRETGVNKLQVIAIISSKPNPQHKL